MSSTIQLKIGTRSSPLALVQVEEITALLAEKGIKIDIDLVRFTTQGDQDQTTSLTDAMVPDDFFTNTIDKALFDGDIDVAIHSAKDLPEQLADGLEILALTRALDESDAFVGNVAFHDLPSGAKVGTSSFVRQESIKKLRPDLEIVDIRGTIEERIQLVKDGVCDGVIVATIALKRLGLKNAIKDIMPWEGTPLQGSLAVVGRLNEETYRETFETIDARRTYGIVTLVGAGPGDPDLITLKGTEALQTADCVFYDYLVDKRILKHAPQAETIYVGKRKGFHSLPQPELSRKLRIKAMEGKTVVRLKGGDPLIFGRGSEELSYLQAYHIKAKVIPGVSSATAIPSSLDVPLTARGVSRSVAFVSAHHEEEIKEGQSKVFIPNTETIVFFMGLSKLQAILDSLSEAGRPGTTPIMIVSRGTRIDEQHVVGTLENIQAKLEQASLKPPALIIVGETVSFWKARNHLPIKVLHTGTNPQLFASLGHVIHHPMIILSKAELSSQDVGHLKNKLNDYDMFLFTSRYGVGYFLELLEDHGISLEPLANKPLISIGKHTTDELRFYGLEPDLTATVETSQGLLEEMIHSYELEGKSILFPRSFLPNPYLKDGLAKKGANVDQLAVYNNHKPGKRDLPQNGINAVLFTSPSTVKNFLEDYAKIPDNWTIISKGPLTTKAIQSAGYNCEELT